MRILREWIHRLRGTLHPGREDGELEEELRLHLELSVEDERRRGRTLDEAMRTARIRAGGASQVMDALRDQQGLPWLHDLARDLRYGLRTLWRSPGFTAITLLTLATGIGASTAVFSLVNTVLLRPLPFADPERLVVLWEDVSAAGFPRNTPAPANYVDWKAQNQTFEDMAAAVSQTFNLTGTGEAERLNGFRVTANFLALLGVRPTMGRLMGPTEDNPDGDRVAVVSHGLWRRSFGSDPNLVGRRIRLNDQSHRVIGVAPEGFQFPERAIDVWVAPGFTVNELAARNSHYLFVIGRLKATVTLSEARAEMTTIAKRLEMQYPDFNNDVGIALIPLREHYIGELRLALNLLLSAVGVLLLIACANLAHLFLARQTSRGREIAMRAALGAGRWRIVRQLLTECTMFALAAAALGAAFATGGFGFLARLIPARFPEDTVISFDWRVFCFTAGVAVTTAIVFGAVPAIHAWRLDLNTVLRGAAGRASMSMGSVNLRGAVVITEVALTVVLLVGAGLLLTSYVRLRGVNTGFRAENLLTLETALPASKYVDLAGRTEFYRQVIERTIQYPGVVSAGYVNFPPLTMKGGSNGFVIDGRPLLRPVDRPNATNRTATADYLRTIGVPLLRGRIYDERDGPESPRVVVINQTMARAYWPGEDALGARIRFGSGGPDQPPYTVIGIVGDVKQMGLAVPPREEMYLPATQGVGGPFFWPRTLVVRTTGDPYRLVADIRRVIAEVDPDQPVANIRTMNDILDNEVSGQKTQTTIVSALAIIALLLASVGLYGVLSYTVAQRTAEIGIRRALGAQPGEAIGTVMVQALRWTAIGATCGVVGALGITRIFSALLFEVSPSDPHTYVAVTLLLVTVAILASFVPAWRAATVDPMIALRHE